MSDNSLYFLITHGNDYQCYFNCELSTAALLDIYYHDERPDEVISQLENNVAVDIDDYSFLDNLGEKTCLIDMDNDKIVVGYGKGNHYEIDNASKVPFGAALVLLRYLGSNALTSISDNEYYEKEDIRNLYGYGDPDIKEQGFVVYSNNELFSSYLDYLKSTGSYPELFTFKHKDNWYLAFDSRGRDNIQSFMWDKVQQQHSEANELAAAIRYAFRVYECSDEQTDDDEMEME